MIKFVKWKKKKYKKLYETLTYLKLNNIEGKYLNIKKIKIITAENVNKSLTMIGPYKWMKLGKIILKNFGNFSNGKTQIPKQTWQTATFLSILKTF